MLLLPLVFDYYQCCVIYLDFLEGGLIVILVYIQLISSTAIDGKIKACLYDLLGTMVDYDGPRLWCTTMAYNVDGAQ